MAASLVGWYADRNLAAQSPTTIWNGVTTAPSTNGMAKPTRW
jgi:hypothetical protein